MGKKEEQKKPPTRKERRAGLVRESEQLQRQVAQARQAINNASQRIIQIDGMIQMIDEIEKTEGDKEKK